MIGTNADDLRGSGSIISARGLNARFFQSRRRFFSAQISEIINWWMFILPGFSFWLLFMIGVSFVLVRIQVVIIRHVQKTPAFRSGGLAGTGEKTFYRLRYTLVAIAAGNKPLQVLIGGIKTGCGSQRRVPIRGAAIPISATITIDCIKARGWISGTSDEFVG